MWLYVPLHVLWLLSHPHKYTIIFGTFKCLCTWCECKLLLLYYLNTIHIECWAAWRKLIWNKHESFCQSSGGFEQNRERYRYRFVSLYKPRLSLIAHTIPNSYAKIQNTWIIDIFFQFRLFQLIEMTMKLTIAQHVLCNVLFNATYNRPILSEWIQRLFPLKQPN